MLPNLYNLSLRSTPCGTVHTRPPVPDICAICQHPLWGVEGDDEDDEGGDATKRVGRVNMPPDLKSEVRRRLGERAFNRLVEPSRLLAPPDKWRMRHEQGDPAQPVPVISLSCDHWFHVSCIANWAEARPHQPQCPNCKSANQPDQRIIDQDLRDMGTADLIPPPPPPPPPTVAEARGMLDEAQQRQRAEAQLQRRIRQERAEYERRERERVLREANRLKSIARLRLVLARRAIKHFEDKSKDLSQYSRWEKRKKSLEKAVLTRTRVLQTAQQNLDTKDVRSRAERRELQANVTEQELKLENTRAALQSVEANLQRHTKPVLTYVDAALYYRGKAYLALAAAMADETQAATAENTGRVRGWLGLLLSRAQDMEQRGMTQWSDEKGAFFDQVVDTQTSPQRMVSQQDFARALAQLITMPSAKARWMDGGGYARAEDVVVPNGGSAMVVRGATHTYGTGFGELSRGLWMIDPLVPMPGMETAAGGNQVQWPPQPQGEVPTPDGVSLWMWSRDRERWEPGGLQEERRLRQRSEP